MLQKPPWPLTFQEAGCLTYPELIPAINGLMVDGGFGISWLFRSKPFQVQSPPPPQQRHRPGSDPATFVFTAALWCDRLCKLAGEPF